MLFAQDGKAPNAIAVMMHACLANTGCADSRRRREGLEFEGSSVRRARQLFYIALLVSDTTL